ncbi:MAG: hypothetical protein HW416_1313 [Chloroflexi bacterium]|nr:hypothetical protein [Chloroflexota bacterium]
MPARFGNASVPGSLGPSVAPWVCRLSFLAIFLFAMGLSGCGQSVLPSQAGDYQLQNNEIRFDGEAYSFRWVERDNSMHLARTDDVKLVQGDATFLRIGEGAPTLHLAQDQAVQVAARDQRGSFGTPWYPFFWGPIGGGPVIVAPADFGQGARTPSYRYPPSDSFSRGDSLGGSVPSAQPKPPDYTRLPNASNTVGGQSGGTGGGVAATGRDISPISGQSGGSGGGSAASSKGGFQSGPNAFSESRSSSSAPRVGAGGVGSSGALKSPQAGSSTKTSPSMPSTASKGISGARSGGGKR